MARHRAQDLWPVVVAMDKWVLARQLELTAIPAPPFGEGPRGERVAELFMELGLEDIRTDEAGNVIAHWPPGGTKLGGKQSNAEAIVVSAHLDTVFPAGTDVAPKFEGNRICAPGITDDGRGLAAVMALARLISELPVPLTRPVLFVATVGEEGQGDLRGVRHLFRAESPLAPVFGFISLDGVGLDRIIHRGVGSTRLRITVRGRGGHSWTDYGRPNPIHRVGRIVSRLGSLPLPADPKTSLTVARWAGGTSINSIPQEAWFEVDLRSVDAAELETLERTVREVCREELEEASNSQSQTNTLSLEIEELGRRPAGVTDPSHMLVQAAMEATRHVGEKPQLIASSTDANLPMSLGIPAITLGAGGRGGGVHTVEEWFENTRGPEGIFRALLTVLLLEEA
ncbi:MAG: M20/M25/M40 family metallo-hydrolase [Gemmatimonadetes bacterium]|nr:M20/M25/M40 family metallo-hydrolase [Gemmatimonadota bacterium]NNM04133.1 M20/M25/M40 family metallo-hydrolase [Gemmatimonadota bacterium]